MSKTVAAAEFEAHPMDVINEVAEKQEEVVIVLNGQPHAKIVPVVSRRLMTLDELRTHGVTILGDIVEPLYGDWDPEL